MSETQTNTIEGQPQPKIRDRLFIAIFGKDTERSKRWRLDLYNTLNGTNYTDPDALKLNTIENVIFVTMYNDVYSRAACVSPTLMIVEDPLRKEISARDLAADTRIYLSWGSLEGGDDPHSPFAEYVSGVNRGMQALLSGKGAFTSLFLQAGGRHCEADWEKQLPVFMNYLWL